MHAALAPQAAPVRGADLLLAHCAVLDAETRAPAPDRLRERIGEDLASLLVTALAAGGGGRYRDLAY